MDLSLDINLDSASGLDLRPKDNRFKFELNLGLALPTKFRASKNYDVSKDHVSVVKSVTDDGSVAMLKVTTQSNTGPLGAFDNDVLTVLLTMAYEQRDYNSRAAETRNGYRVYYTHFEICRRLGLKEGSSGYVSEAIDRISSQNLTLDNFAFQSGDKRAFKKNEQTKIILKKGRVSLADGTNDHSEYTSYFYLEFDNFVVRNLYNDYVSVLNSNQYLSLKSGPCRRTYVYLMSKKKVFGTSFVFELTELSQVLGLADSTPKKQRELIGKYLKAITEELNTFDFNIDKVRAKNSWTVLIQFKEQVNLIEDEVTDKFYEAICLFYGTEKVTSVGIHEIDIINYRKELEGRYFASKSTKEFTFQKEVVSPADFAMDIALYQVIKQGYRVTKSFKALVKAIVTSMVNELYELPEGYRYFIYKRNEDLKKKEVKKLLESEKLKQDTLKKDEEEKLHLAFRKFYKDIISKNKRQMSLYDSKAREELKNEETDENDMMYSLLLQTKIETLAKRDFDNGDLMNLATSDGGKLLS